VADIVNIEILLTGDEIEGATYRDTYADLVNMLRDVELHVRNRKRSRVHWYVTDEDPEVRLHAFPNGVPADQISHVARDVRTGFERILEADGRHVEWPQSFGTQAKRSAQRIVKRLNSLESITVTVDHYPPLLIESVALRAEYGRSGYVEFTSIDGVLDLISVRGRPHFSIREHDTNHHIRCVFSDDLFEKVKDSLRKRVVVEGVVQFDKEGTPKHIGEITNIWERPQPQLEFDGIAGSRPEFTGGVPAGEYVRRLRIGDDAD
jgi:hypothetical protein